MAGDTENDQRRPMSTEQFVTAIVSNGAIFGVFLTAFLLLRLKLKRIYQPKSSFKLINEEKRPDPLPSGLWQWFIPLLKKSDNFIIQQAGLDGYFFIRYLYIIATFCAVSTLWILPILLPINAANGTGKTGLDQLAYSNVKHRGRYYAHVFVGWVFFWGFLFVVYRELTYYTSLRQAVLASPRYAKKLSSRTVLFQNVPDQYLSESEFPKLFTGVKRIWITRGASELGKKVNDRDNMAMKLEAAETAYLRQGIKAVIKQQKKAPGAVSNNISDYVPDNKRPTHRLKPIFGKKVDTIDYIKEQLPLLNAEIEELQASHMDSKPFNSVFVEFESQYAAQMAVQAVTHHTGLQMTPAYAGIEPKHVMWFNMRMFWWERLVRKFGSMTAIVALVVLWAFPVAFVGMVSNISYLIDKLHWLEFLNKLPHKLFGILTSLAPTVALAVLMMLLPIFIRKMALVSGSPSVQHVEHFTQQAFFAFQVIQVFLVTTISSSATSTVTAIIEKPTSAMSMLASNLPLSSNFYISYTLLQGLSVSSGALLQVVPLILFYVLGFFLDNTARKLWGRFTGLSAMSWGTTFPVYTNLAVVVFSYAIISPIILIFAAVGFFLLYVAYLYNLTYVFEESPDSRGIHYPRALFQTLVGLYIGQICLLGLFVVGKGWGPIVLQAICLGVTVFVHINLNAAFDHLMQFVPVDTMKPLDGKSDTPSFVNIYSNKAQDRDEIKELPHFPVKKYHPRNSMQLDQRTNSVLSENTYEINENIVSGNENNLITVPLLADGDTSPVPPAPFWKRYFLPHIYNAYKVAKTRLPEIYSLPDPDENANDSDNAHAYDYPAVSAKCPYLWIPRDPYGWSTTEIAKLHGIVEISDEGAAFNEKGKISWTAPPPSYKNLQEEKINPFDEED